jgi:hypothetical protein
VSAIHMLYYKDLVNVAKKIKVRTVTCAALMLKLFIYYLNGRQNTGASRCESHTLEFRVNQRFLTIRIAMNFVRSKEKVL